MRPRLPALATGVLVLGLVAACTQGAVSPLPPSQVAPNPRLGAGVAVAYDLSGRGDGGFNDIAYAGARKAAEKYGVEVREVTARMDDTDDDRAERLRLLAEAGFGAIIAVGFTYAGPLQVVAAEFPGTSFAIVDDGTVTAPNVQGILFAEHEGSFLVGAAAGLTTTTGSVGFIGAVQIPLIEKFEAGYAAGVEHVNAEATVTSTYLSQPPDYSGFGDPPHGREAALGMYENGVDVIFAAAGGSGAGVHEAAAETDHWSIGVDADEYLLAPEAVREHILTSMLKRADVGTFTFVSQVAEGAVRAGVVTYGLAESGVGWATSGGFVDGLRERLEGLAEDIAAGRIVVPETP